MIIEPAQTVSQRILITGGRAPVALELARLLHRKGHQVYIAESSPYHLCRVSNAVVESISMPPPRQQPQTYISALKQWIIEHQIDLLIPTCEEIFYIAQGLDVLQPYCRVLTPHINTLHRLHHKGQFIEQVTANQQVVPMTFPVPDPSSDLYDYSIPDQQGHVFVRKPVYSRFASKVIMPWESTRSYTQHNKLTKWAIYPDKSKNKASINEMNSNSKMSKKPQMHEISKITDINKVSEINEAKKSPTWIAQQYIKGKAICTYSVVHEGVVIAHATYTSNYRTSSAGASVYFEAIEHPETYEWVCQFVKSIYTNNEHDLSFSGQISFDFIEQSATGQLYPIECNPRTTSGIHLFAQDDRFVQALIDPISIVHSEQVIMPKIGTARMLTLPMWIAGIKYNRTLQDWRNWWKCLQYATDVVYQSDDRKPFWEQFRLVYQAYRTSRRQHISITEALTYDIEWNGKENI